MSEGQQRLLGFGVIAILVGAVISAVGWGSWAYAGGDYSPASLAPIAIGTVLVLIGVGMVARFFVVRSRVKNVVSE